MLIQENIRAVEDECHALTLAVSKLIDSVAYIIPGGSDIQCVQRGEVCSDSSSQADADLRAVANNIANITSVITKLHHLLSGEDINQQIMNASPEVKAVRKK